MRQWNVVITVHDGGYNEARRLLRRFGPVDDTEYFNLLLMRIEEPRLILDRLLVEGREEPGRLSCLARVMPVEHGFSFMTPAEFQEKAAQALSRWLPQLGGKSFHLRMHRRGFKGRLSSMQEEKALDTFLLEELERMGTPGRISFEDPDQVIALETVGPAAGLSLWGREELGRYPLLHLD